MNRSIFLVLVVAIIVGVGFNHHSQSTSKSSASSSSEAAIRPTPTVDTELVPVETDMHDFMEDYFQTTFRRLQKQMRKEPEDVQGWKAIKSDAIIFAESGNLLIGRHEEDAADWDQFSVDVRKHGTEMYKNAKEKTFDATKEHFTAMIESCNACHKKFADGKHQLKVQ